MKIWRSVSVVFMLIGLMGCSQSGVQGTDLFSKFTGIEKAEALSPRTVRLSWTLDSRYLSYNVYMNGSTSPYKTETFSTTLISNLEPSRTYTFNVTGVDVSGSEKAVGGTLSVTTLSVFEGLSLGGVTLRSSTEVGLTWNMNSKIANYRIFKKKQAETWNLATPDGSIIGNNQYVISNLTPGENYCFYVQARYGDSSNEPAAATENAINALAPCVRLTSSMENIPSVSVTSAAPGPFPWFWTSNGDPTYTTEVFELGADIRVASRIGNGTFRSFVKHSESERNFYALVSKGSQVARVPVEVIGQTQKAATKIRSINSEGTKGPLFPALMNGGFGQQNYGGKVVNGDFNCDGLADLAVSLPTAVLGPTQEHYVDLGAVIVYYSEQKAGPCFDENGDQLPACPVEFITQGEPLSTNTYPNPMLITYPAIQNQMNFGINMTTANFNGDCFDLSTKTRGNCNGLFASSTISNRSRIKTCDDLVIGTTKDTLYIVYGDSTKGLVTGSGASTAGVDEFTCDSYSNACRVVRMTKPASYRAGSFGEVFTVGDFNNDGFDDLAVAANRGIMDNGLRDVLLYRGSGQGLYPQGTAGNHAKISNDTYHAVTAPGGSMDGTKIVSDIDSDSSFAQALGTAYDSRYCVNGTPAGYVFRSPAVPSVKGYDFTKCDDVVIGSPGRASNRGSIFACQSFQPAGSQQITSWSCSEHFPTTLGANSYYGSYILGAKNQNGYPINNISGTGGLPNTASALFVGAPLENVNGVSNAGAVYAYYGTPSVSGAATSYTQGGIARILGALGHSVGAINTVACDRYNANVSDAGVSRCHHQKITMPTPENNARFGSAMASVPLTYEQSAAEESMKMLVVAAPNRTVLRVDGTGSVSGAGSVFLYRPDLSTFGNDPVGGPITAPHYNSTCPAGGACEGGTRGTWYSGGVSPFGPSVIYPNTLKVNSLFGSGGIAFGNFDGDDAWETDLVISAPQLNDPTPKSGAAYLFTANDGYAPAENAPAQVLTSAMGLEGGYRFEEMKVVGDINGDGFDDLVGHISANGQWNMVVFYGSSQGVIRNPKPSPTASGTQPQLVSLSSDSLFAQNIFPAGDMNGDGFADVFAAGNNGSYLYYGSSAGLVISQTPAVSPIGKGPLRFATGGGITFSDLDGMVGPSNPSYNTDLNSFAHGDFNGDGFGDIAVRWTSTGAPGGGIPDGGLSFESTQVGRVVVIYGSVNGPQVNRVTGRISLTSDVAVSDPCLMDIYGVASCKVQVLGLPHATNTKGYSFALATVKTKANSQYHFGYDRLLVSDIDHQTRGSVFVFNGGLTGVQTTAVQRLVGPSDALSFGFQMISAGDINGDFYDDVVISDEKRIYVFYGGKDINGEIGYYGDSAGLISGIDYWHSTPGPIGLNEQMVLASSPRPQKIRPGTATSGVLFAWGLAAVGDFNNDGFADVMVNTPNGDSTIEELVPAAGYGVVYFGSELGLQVKNLTPTPFPRCYRGATPLCDPFQVFIPDAVPYENTTISPYSVGDVNGDGFRDVVIGVAGRDLVTPGMRSATSTGAIYILY